MRPWKGRHFWTFHFWADGRVEGGGPGRGGLKRTLFGCIYSNRKLPVRAP